MLTSVCPGGSDHRPAIAASARGGPASISGRSSQMLEYHPLASLALRSLATASACLLGCLPAGNPPVGQHVLADRTLTDVHLSPSEVPGVPSYLLVTGPLRA